MQKWAAVRRRRCRWFVLSSVHGFTLRASPAVKHGVSPPGTVGEHERYSAQLHPCISSMLLQILSFSTSPIVTLSHSLWYVCFCGYPHCTSSASTSTQSNVSGGGAPCVTAGDTRAKRGGTRGQADYSDPDAGGVALKAWRGNSDVQKWAAVRRRRCRWFVLSSVHGFTLRASPAVKHGVSPPGTVGENAVSLGRVDAIRVQTQRLIVFSNAIST